MKVTDPQYPCHIEISKSAIKQNIDYIKQNLLEDGRELCCVIKGNAYGHGIEQLVPLHQEINKIKNFGVYSANEAYKIKNSLIAPANIMIMGYIEDEVYPWVIENQIEFYIYDTSQLEQVITIAKKAKKIAKIHIEVETGMNRTGILDKNFQKCASLILENKRYLEVIGLCTHFSGAESLVNHLRVRNQIKRYKRFKERAQRAGLEIKKFHTACSAAALRFKNTRMDMLRIGILQYGFWPNQETYIDQFYKSKLTENPLKRVIAWKSKVMTIKKVNAGEFIGYGNNYFANEDQLIAVIPVGYAHGYTRQLSNSARVIIREEYARVTGIVNMNAISVDVTHIPGIKIGDEVVLIGHQGHKEITVASFSEFTDQLNYELLSRLPVDMPRHIVD